MAQEDEDGFLNASMKQQLSGVFTKLNRKLIFKAVLDNRPISTEVKDFLREICELSDWLSCSFEQGDDPEGLFPEIRLETENGYSGISFHGVLGGHETNSFVVAVYNLAGPGQPIDNGIRKRIKTLNQPARMTIAATLSCTMCPDLVMAAQRIASLNPIIEAHMLDLSQFPQLKEKYNIMSVPGLILNNDGNVLFGKKDVPELLDILEKTNIGEIIRL